jgi:hypothetical protein
MIVLDLLCDNGHRFDGWFASTAAFRDQMAKGLVQCVLCQTAAIKQLPSAPHVRRAGGADAADSADSSASETHARTGGHHTTHAATPGAGSALGSQQGSAGEKDREAQMAESLFAAIAKLARQAEDVGDRLPEEARKIHYEEAPARSIRGQATPEEARELLEEGILVLPAPVPPESETH